MSAERRRTHYPSRGSGSSPCPASRSRCSFSSAGSRAVAMRRTTARRIRPGRTGRTTTSGRAASARSRCCSQASCFCTSRRRSEVRSGVRRQALRGSAQLARVAFAGAITGMAGMVMAIVIIASATTEGADANPGRDSCGGECLGRAFPALCHGLRCVPHGRWAPDTSKRSLRTLDRRRGAHRRGCGFSSRSLRSSRAWARTACSASASSLASWRS